MKQKILDYIKRQNGGVTFVELGRLLGDQIKGDLAMHAPTNEAIVFWAGLSTGFVDAVQALLEEGEIVWKSTSSLTYIIDGGYSPLPLVKGNYNYKRDHWLPIVFNLVG